MKAGMRRWYLIPLLAMIAGMVFPVQDLGAATEVKPSGEVQAGTVVARVNGQPIYQERLAPQVQAELRRFKKFNTQKPPPEDLIKTLSEKALQRVIAVELLYQASKNLDIPDIDERISKKMEEMRHRHASGLKDMSDEEIRESIRRQIYVHEYLLVNGLAEPKVPEEEIREYYEKNKQAFASKGSYRARHILRTVPADATPEEKAEARRQIEEARRLILEGRPFAEVASEYSQCNTASGGGDLGPREKGYMPPEFEAVAFSIEPGKLSDVVETRFGYHILEVLKRTPEGSVPSYEDTRESITKFLQREHSRKKMDDRIRQLREKATIEVFLQ